MRPGWGLYPPESALPRQISPGKAAKERNGPYCTSPPHCGAPLLQAPRATGRGNAAGRAGAGGVETNGDMKIRGTEFLEASSAIGCKKGRIILKHVLPNSIAPLIVQTTMTVANSILTAASLSYVGLGVQPPTPEWGAMLSAGRTYIRNYPYLVIFPGLFIAVTVLALNMFGDGIRDVLDPKLKK